MFITTNGIVLKSHPFKDNSYIVKIFTYKSGLLSFIVKKTKKQFIIHQPLTILEITYRKKESSTLCYIKDAHVQYPYNNLIFNSQKIQIAIVLSEILQKCLSEENQELYKFIINAFKWLDLATGNYSGFTNLFLIKFCAINGLRPYEAFDFEEHPGQQLDLQQGVFLNSSEKTDGVHRKNNIVPAEESLEIFKLSRLDFRDLETRDISVELDDSIFNYLLKFISIHLTDLSAIKSIKILKEIF